MSRPEWQTDLAGVATGVALNGTAPGSPPLLAVATRQAIGDAIRGRIPTYTPTWSNPRSGDPGMALIQLFSEQMQPVLVRLNRLPMKAMIEFLNVAGTEPHPATAALALLQFTVADAAPQSVQVPQGFQVGAPPKDGQGDRVVFETTASMFAAPGKIAESFANVDGVFRTLDLTSASSASPVQPFGDSAAAGTELWLGLSSGVAPQSQLAIGFGVAGEPGQPPSVGIGQIPPIPLAPAPLLQWDILNGASFTPVVVVTDETSGLTTTGIVTLALPQQWPASPRPAGMPGSDPLRWLRLRIAYGSYASPPFLSYVLLNVVLARAARTVLNEILQPVPGTSGAMFQLSQTPVIPGTLLLTVDDGAVPDPGVVDPPPNYWQEVSSLLGYPSDASVFTLDPDSGQVTFPAPVPAGFANVQATSYQFGGGPSGAIDAGQATSLLGSVPFLTAVTNPLPASGGTARETNAQVIDRGPKEIRTRERAVTVADYGLLALTISGARVARAQAFAGLHPDFTGTAIPGVVGVLVVSSDPSNGAPPIPDAQTLRAVATGLHTSAAPAGVEVVAGAPRFHDVRVEAVILPASSGDSGAIVQSALDALNTYLNPVIGGDDGTGWPFGGTLRYQTFLLLLANLPGVHAVEQLSFVLDGNRSGACQDCPIPPASLPWPGAHRIVIQDPKGVA